MILIVAAAIACEGLKPAPPGGTSSLTRAVSAASDSSSNRQKPEARDKPDSIIQSGPVKGVNGLILGGECPDPGPSAEAEIAAQASALIPLKVGLTLSLVARGHQGGDEYECLEQIATIGARGIVSHGSCPAHDSKKAVTWRRRICRVDMRNSYLYVTEVGPYYPETFQGALKYSLSSASLAALKTAGQTRHRYFQFPGDLTPVQSDVDGLLKSDGKNTFKIIINDQVVEVPTIEASYRSADNQQSIRMKVLDDENFPIVLDYYHPYIHFFITYSKISYPTAGDLEKHLATEKHVDVYGIYFNFASDSIRPESEPVLKEIGAALASNPEWKLTINGHTDSVGTAASNLDLSRRRSEAVRNALIQRYKVDGARLSTSGYGASQPKESNDTDVGRARNRRVELVRQ